MAVQPPHERPLRGGGEPSFRSRSLGDKSPTFDYLVEGVDWASSFFFVQVKGTPLGYTAEERRLRVQATHDDIGRMVARPAPTLRGRD